MLQYVFSFEIWFTCFFRHNDTTRRTFRIVNKILTLTTDFGTQDAYVAALKGVILSINPGICIVDNSHLVSPQDIMEAAFILRQAVPFFPEETTHLVVVDPGVGSERLPVAVRMGRQFFVGPDNGLLSLVFNGSPPDEAYILDKPEFWRDLVPSNTFHGRDIFAPVAAHLASGTPISELGTPLKQLKRLHWALPIVDAQGIQGWVVHIDRFGNCITNIPRATLDSAATNLSIKCYIGSTIIDSLSSTYTDQEEGEPLMLYGSNDFLEIAIHAGNASKLLSIRKGDPVQIVFIDDK